MGSREGGIEVVGVWWCGDVRLEDLCGWSDGGMVGERKMPNDAKSGGMPVWEPDIGTETS